jgi:hypothetical protein
VILKRGVRPVGGTRPWEITGQADGHVQEETNSAYRAHGLFTVSLPAGQPETASPRA